MKRLVILAAALAIVAAAVFPLAASAGGGRVASGTVTSADAVSRVKLNHGLTDVIERRGFVDATVTFRNDAVLERVRPAAEAGDAAGAIATLAAEYRALKQRVLSRSGGDAVVVREFEHLPTTFVRFRSTEALALVASSPEVLSVTEQELFEPTLDESRALIRAGQAAASGNIGAGTYVAVLDTGADYTRSAFGSCTAPNVPTSCKVFRSKKYNSSLEGQDAQLDDNGHGTNVSGIVVGVAPGTKVFALDVFTGSGDGYGAQDVDIKAALEDVMTWRQQGYAIKAVNMSLGWSGKRYTSTCTTHPEGQTNPMTPLFAQLRTLGIVPVVAAGNDGYVNGVAQDGISYPACTAGAVSVGAVYDDEQGFMSFGNPEDSTYDCWDWTSEADQVTCFSQSSPNLTLLAPGSTINAAGISSSGTSQAAPHVAGAIAVLAAARPSATITQIQSALTTTGPLVADPRFGGRQKRRLDVVSALAALPAGSGDTIAPTVGSVTQVMPSLVTTTGSSIDSLGRVPVKASWSAFDSGSGLAALDVEVATNGVWSQLSTPSATQTSVTVHATPGTSTYQFRVAAKDAAGNWSAWVYGASFKLTVFQEASTSIAYAGSWTQLAWSSAFGGSMRTSSQLGATARLSFTGRNVAVVSTTASNRGQVTFSVDGSQWGTRTLTSSTTLAKAVAFSYAWPTSGTHTIEVKVASGTVDADAFVVMS